MGTIVGSTGATCNVAASDAAINSVPNLRPFLSKSLDVATKANKPLSQTTNILNKQISTVANNPQKYTPKALEQCSANLDKAAAQNPNVDILESLTNTGYMPPEADVPISGATPTAQVGQGVTEALAPYAGMRDVSNASGRTVNDIVNVINNGGTVKAIPDTVISAGTQVVYSGDQAYMLPYGSDGPYIPVPSNVQVAFGEEGTKYTTSSVTLPAEKAQLYDKSGNFVTEVKTTGTPGVYAFQTQNNDGGLNIYFGANHETGTTSPIANANQIQFTPSHGLGGITGVVRSFSEATGPIAQIAMALAAPGVGSLIAEGLAGAGLAISETAANAIGKAALSMAAGQDPASAIQDAVTSVVVQTGSTQLAKEVQDGVKAISNDQKLATLVAGAAGGAIASAAITAAKGGSQEDVVNAALAGAVGSGVATETESRALGQAVAGGLTQGATGAITGAVTGQLADDKKAATATAGGGVPLPPGGKVGVTFSVDGAGNALVMYQDGTTATVQVDPSVQPGASVTVDQATNVATVGAPSAVTTGGEQVAGPGGMTAQTVASMPEMQPRQGETAGNVTPLGTDGYMRQFTGTRPDGTQFSYDVYYYPNAPEGQQVQYATAFFADKSGNIVSPGYTGSERPDFSAPASATGGGGAPAPSSTAVVSGGGAEEGGPSGIPTPGTPAIITSYPTFTPIQYGFPTPNQPAFISNIGGAPAGAEGGPSSTGGFLPTTPVISIPTDFSQVLPGADTTVAGLPGAGGGPGAGGLPGAATTTFGGQPGVTVDEFGLPVGGPTARRTDATGLGAGGVVTSGGEGGGEGPGAVGGAGPGAGAGGGDLLGTGGGDGTGAGAGGPGEGTGEGGPGDGTGGGEPPPTEEPPPEEIPPPEETPSPYLISGGISPRPRRQTRTLGTALQTPFTSSLITSGLTSYRGAGEIESPESGKRRSNVWNEASLRLKDALGI